MRVSVVVLAAGQGTRMRSSLPKVLHPLAGRPMLLHVIQTAQEQSETTPVLVVGVGAEQVRSTVGERVRYAVQKRQLGTGHAVLQAKPLLVGESEMVLVTYADMPLLRTDTLRQLVEHHRLAAPAITMLTVIQDNARGFGRVARDASGAVLAVVEEADATPEQLAICELNTGTYCFDASWLWARLEQIPLSATGEYYLTDLIEMAATEGGSVQTLTTDDPLEVLGVNTRVHLAEAEAALRQRVNERWMLNGVTIIDPATAYIEADVTLGLDTVVYPNTWVEGKTRIGADCRIGPNTVIRDSILGDRCNVFASVIEGSTLENEADVGPFGHLRNGAHLTTGVGMGRF